MREDRPELSLILVSYNTRQMILDCLTALTGAVSGVTSEVWVVDNASEDGTVDAIRDQCPWVHVIANENNRGFGAANNQAMAQARGRYFMLLNTDAFVSADAVRTLNQTLTADPSIGVVGPKLLNGDGSIQQSCYPFPKPGRAWLENLGGVRLLEPFGGSVDYHRWEHNTVCDVDWLIGACMLVRREVWEQVGGFDERFFLYAEETDWQRRIRDADWRIRFTPEAKVTHLGGASGAAERARVNGHFFQSLDQYQKKHHGWGGFVSVRLAMVTGAILRLPYWAAVYIASPARRGVAGAKLRLQAWLFWRQATRWSAAAKTG